MNASRFAARLALPIPWTVALMALCVVTGLLTGAGVAAGQDATPTPTPQTQPGAPVIVDGVTLFRLQQRIGSVLPGERATLISNRIHSLISNPFLPEVRLELIDGPDYTDVVANLGSDAGSEILLTVTNADALAAGRNRYQLASEWEAALETAIETGKARYGVRSMVFAALEALVALLIVFLAFKGTNRLYRRAAAWLDAGPNEQSRFRVLRNLELYQSGALNRVLRAALRWARVAFWALGIIVLVPVLFSFFPQTQAVARSVAGYVRKPLVEVWDGVTGYLPNLVFVAVILFLLWALTRVVTLVFREIERGTIRIAGFEPEWSRLTARLVMFMIVAGGAVVIYPYLPGSDSAAFKGVTVFIGLVLSLSSTSAVANIVAGIIQTYTGAFRIGDVISLNGVTGEVVARTLLVTRVRTWKNEIVSIPNSLALNNDVLNYPGMVRQGGLTLPWRQVHELMISAALGTPDILAAPPPFVLQTALNDYNASYQLNAYTDQPQRIPRIYSALHQNIQDCFNAAGVEIMSPAYAALRDGNNVTTPASYLPPAYQPPSFRVTPVATTPAPSSHDPNK